MAAVPRSSRHVDCATLLRVLRDATSAVAAYAAANWRPRVPTVLLDEIAGDWRSTEPRLWVAGSTTGDAIALQRRPTAAAAFSTVGPVVTVDRTGPNRVVTSGGTYYAAYEPLVAAELTSSLVLGAHAIGTFDDVAAVDVAIMVAAGTAENSQLVPAESYAPAGLPWAMPSDAIRPTPPFAPTHFSEAASFDVAALQTYADRAARTLLDPWLAVFRDRDIFEGF